MSELGIRVRDVGRSRAEVRVGTDGRTQGRAAEAAGHDVADGLVSAELTIVAVKGPFSYPLWGIFAAVFGKILMIDVTAKMPCQGRALMPACESGCERSKGIRCLRRQRGSRVCWRLCLMPWWGWTRRA